MKKLGLLATLLVSLAFVNNAQAAVINFDELSVGTYGTMPLNHYAGATWYNFGVLDPAIYTVSGGSYSTAMQSKYNVAYNRNANSNASLVFDAAVNLEKIYFSSVYTDEDTNNITLNWTLADGTTGSQILNLVSTAGQWEVLNLTSVKSLTFLGNEKYFAMDDITYSTPAPEPASATLGLMSLAGLLGFRKRNK